MTDQSRFCRVSSTGRGKSGRFVEKMRFCYICRMKRILLIALVVLLASCTAGIKTGDLVFVGIPADYSLDESEMDGAISAATGSKDALNLIHVAILEVGKDTTWIIDATIKHGVDRHPLDTMLKEFTLKDGSQPTYIIKRLKNSRNAAQYVENAKKFLGRPYDVWFSPDNEAMYCSELVRDSYRTPDGDYLFDAKPMNFKNEDGEFPLYWQQLFALIGQSIPQDEPGTNPQDMSSAPVLKLVSAGL